MDTFLIYFYVLNEAGLYELPVQIGLIVLILALSLFLFFRIRKNKRADKLRLTENNQNNFLKSILDYSGNGNAILDADGNISYANSGFCDLFKEDQQILLGKNINQIPELNELQQNFEHQNSSIVEFTGKDGNRHSIKYFTVKDENQNVIGRFLKKLPDISGRNGELDLDISHELKTPLHAVLGFSEILNKEADLTAEQQKLLEKIIYHSKQLDGKIKNLVGAGPAGSASAKPVNGEKKIKKILVVDDVSINRTLLKLMLKRYGLEVQEASNGEAALKILESWNADVILMDLSMPVMDGIETVKAIREKEGESSSASKILAVTATQRYSRNELLTSGFDDLMEKPFKEKELLSRLGINPWE